MFGSRLMVLVGIGLYCLASLGVGLLPGYAAVIVARTIQGVAQAISVPASFALLVHLLPAGKGRTRAVAFYSAGGPTGSLIGMIGAAIAVQVSSWRAIWLAFAVIAALAFVVAWCVAAVDVRGQHVRIDWLGLALTVVGSTLVTFALAQSELAERQVRNVSTLVADSYSGRRRTSRFASPSASSGSSRSPPASGSLSDTAPLWRR